MSNDYIVRPYHPGDEKGIVELLEFVFDGWPHFDLKCTPLDHWRWKFLDNPLKIKTITVGLNNNNIIGCNHSLFQKTKVREEILICSQGVDIAVHQNFRRIGVYNKMHDKKNELRNKYNVSLSYWGTANKILIKRAIKEGHPRFPQPILNMARIQDIDLHLKMRPTKHSLLKKYGYKFLKALKREDMKSSSQDFQINEIDEFDDKIDVFWNKIKDYYNYIIVRDREYLNWRYCDSRGGDYLVRQAEENGQILGYIVSRINRYQKDYPIGYIVDLLTFPDRPDVAQVLLEKSKLDFDKHNVNIIQTWIVRGHPHVSLLNKHGFINSKKNINMFYRPIDVGISIKDFTKSKANQIQFQIGDTDGM